MLPIVAIIGRPNVGKSTLFNVLIGERRAVTSATPGTTRDRVYHESNIGGRRAILVDTGGITVGEKKDLEHDIQMQARVAISEADIVIFLVDAQEPVTANDEEVAHLLRCSGKTIVFVANKSEGKKGDLSQFYELGLGEAIGISSIQKIGLDLLEKSVAALIRKLKKTQEPKKKSHEIHISIVGRPNVGKSSLLNKLIGTERSIVSEIPGTTVDTLDARLETENGIFVLTDTAGIRRRGRIAVGIEKFGVLRALQSIDRADVACLIIDATEGITSQDLHVSNFILSASKGLIIVVNKSDLFEDPQRDQEAMLRMLRYRMEFIAWAPVVFISAKTGKNVDKILSLAAQIFTERQILIPQKKLNLFLASSIAAHPPGGGVRIFDIEQDQIAPPTFVFGVNKPHAVHFSYRRFLQNELRRLFGFQGTAIRLFFKKA